MQFNYKAYASDGKWNVRIYSTDEEEMIKPWVALTAIIIGFGDEAPNDGTTYFRYGGTLDDTDFITDKEEEWRSDHHQAQGRIDQ